jgi:hypothetical protein
VQVNCDRIHAGVDGVVGGQNQRIFEAEAPRFPLSRFLYHSPAFCLQLTQLTALPYGGSNVVESWLFRQLGL